MVSVPDSRLDDLGKVNKSRKITPTTSSSWTWRASCAGLPQGVGMGNQFLAHIREVDAIVHVVRCFEDDNVIHEDGSVEPLAGRRRPSTWSWPWPIFSRVD